MHIKLLKINLDSYKSYFLRLNFNHYPDIIYAGRSSTYPAPVNDDIYWFDFLFNIRLNKTNKYILEYLEISIDLWCLIRMLEFSIIYKLRK